MTFHDLLKTIVKGFLGLFLLAGLCAALWLVWVLSINFVDEPLTPEARAMLSYQAKAVPDAENGYVMMAGFTAPSGSDWKKVGAERIELYNEQVRASRGVVTENAAKIPAEEETQKLKFSECGGCEETLEMYSGDNEAVLLASLQALLQQQEQIDKALKDNAELVHRYEALQSAAAFSETLLPSLETSIEFDEEKLSVIFQVRRLLLSEAMLVALSGDREPLLDFLERDIFLWRLLMRSDISLFAAMMAKANLAQELRLLRLLLTHVDFSTPELECLRRLLTPLSAEERSLLRALEEEWNARAHMLLRLGRHNFITEKRLFVAFLKKLLFQPQATVNLYAERMRYWKELASLSSSEFAVRHDAVTKAFQEKEEVTEILDILQNPFNYIGYSFVVISDYNYGKQIAISHDLAASLQLTRALLELRLAGIDAGENPEAVPEFLAQADVETLNPYTGKPFEWNEACRRLSFTPQYAGIIVGEITLAHIPEGNAAACASSAASPDP
ncbi:MAG: hypothetical protein FWH15_04865 [Betaproteobacteria bacterium]|nr:hypothetical protein [Betaproteobacteria bacterium]